MGLFNFKTMSQNPFSPDYKAQIDLSDIMRDAAIRKARTKQREERLQSDDAEKRKHAKGDLGGLSKRERLPRTLV